MRRPQAEPRSKEGAEAQQASGTITSADSPDKRRRPARFITFEGVDGAGKSTHARRLADRLKAARIGVILTREPGGTPGAESIRGLLVEGFSGRWDPVSEALLLYAARRDHVLRTIRPALERGDWVVCDRFADSSHAYQGYASGVPDALLNCLDEAVLQGLMPDLTVILDLPATEGLARTQRRTVESRFEARGAAFQEQVRTAFRALAEREPERCRLIDAARPLETVADAVWQAVAPLIPGQRNAGAPR